MDLAYDHIQEENFKEEEEKKARGERRDSDLNTEFQEAYNAVASSPWGAKLGGLWGTVRNKGESFYQDAQKEYASASTTASKGINDLTSSFLSRTRALSRDQSGSDAPPQPTSIEELAFQDSQKPSSQQSEAARAGAEAGAEHPESLPADIVKEAESILSRFRTEAASRLKDISKAEDAADEALLKFGSNIRNFFRDAVSIAPPPDDPNAPESSRVLFESKDAEGKRVIHTTRFDAQLHVIHSTLDSFTKDPVSPEWEPWKKDFDVEKKTADIGKDLEKYEELRRAMEKLVPERVEYKDFWRRYYFLRHVVESEEQRRREMLRGAAADPEEEVGWDEDSDEDESSTPQLQGKPNSRSPTQNKDASASKETLKNPVATDKDAEADLLKPRRSNDEKSTADSDASYDIVSGATSRAPGSPKDDLRKDVVAEESDEDWE